MISVGRLKEICEYIEREYGSDTSVVAQIYDVENESRFMGSYVNNFWWNKSGTLFLSNHIPSKPSEKIYNTEIE